ncbi:MAG TPA: long-chain-acyl-CoA synthetase [Steroidobacteraceae bacterium]|nr:long-chain-acyl-CoA synthetase [Steroidobacteraceae bacterium]
MTVIDGKKAWVRALERTAPIERNPHRTLPVVIEELAGRYGSAPALASPEATLTYETLAQTANRYARWALAEGLAPGDVVCLLLENCPDYLAIWLGLTRVGVTVALLNTHLTGEPLRHSMRIVAPRRVIAGISLAERLHEGPAPITESVSCWAHGGDGARLRRVDRALEGLSAEPLTDADAPAPSLSDRALYIYTSGTTGLPKAAAVSHHRLMQWSHWFAGLMGITPADRLYDCLPMYHSVGGVVATCATLVGGGAVVVRERFSASRFWQDVREERCTIFQYIGELCRYLTASPAGPGDEAVHSLRLACGNGLRGEVWKEFQSRFRIPQILEYYAATEGTFSLYNCEGRVGSIGRIPPFLSHRYPVALVRSDPASGAPVRDAEGRCIPCQPGEPGEAIGQIALAAGSPGARFEGYADAEATRRKVLRDVFRPGDAWYRTGDLMSRDAQGFYYFVDRIGDTFRWKGENVSTTEVAAMLAGCRGITDVAVYGVAVPGTEGRAGMAALVVGPEFELTAFRRELAGKLPDYARPVFLRIVSTLEVTGTFKLRKQELAEQGYDPARTDDPIYFDAAKEGRYERLDPPLHRRIIGGGERL